MEAYISNDKEGIRFISEEIPHSIIFMGRASTELYAYSDSEKLERIRIPVSA